MNRPRLLVRAARIGTRDYRREVHLARLLGPGKLPRSGEALIRLCEIEDELNMQRECENAAYSLARHIDVLIAMVSEAAVLKAASATRRDAM